ncbi:MAG: hypothetical protein BMS9Abin37_0595 [Acidobacteriota bacterium]|nr:MAG: hypothetical protein BMS9Abin37_0595 [Acidobacteriota bacterium]
MSNQLALAAALAFAVTGCAQKTVNDVLADPSRYADRNITLQGEVVESYSVAGHGFYRLEDSTGRLWILSMKGVPRTGAYVQVKGKIKDGFDLTSLGNFLSLPEPIRERIESGLLLVESSHKASS